METVLGEGWLGGRGIAMSDYPDHLDSFGTMGSPGSS
jgi:hypothetical protein